MLKPKDVARFWSGLDRSNIDGCWLWTRGCDAGGYGQMGIGGRMTKTHRVAWEIAHGPVPAGKHVLHHCDVRPCGRPDHLFIGGNSDNVADRVAKDRGARLRGSLNGMAVLTEEQVATIKQRYTGSGATLESLGREFGVSTGLIGKIVTGKMWQHVGGVVARGARRGERSPAAILTEAQVREIRARYDRGDKGVQIAADYGIAPSTVTMIGKRKIWRSVG